MVKLKAIKTLGLLDKGIELYNDSMSVKLSDSITILQNFARLKHADSYHSGIAWSDFRTNRTITESGQKQRNLDAVVVANLVDAHNIITGVVLSGCDGQDHPYDDREQIEVANTAYRVCNEVLGNLSTIKGDDLNIEQVTGAVIAAGKKASIYRQRATNTTIHAILDESKLRYKINAINIGDSLSIAYIAGTKELIVLTDPREYEERTIGGASFQPASITHFKPYQIQINRCVLPANAMIFFLTDGLWQNFATGYEIKEQQFEGVRIRYKTPIIDVNVIKQILDNVIGDKQLSELPVNLYNEALARFAVRASEANRRELASNISIISKFIDDIKSNEASFERLYRVIDDKKISITLQEFTSSTEQAPELIAAVKYLQAREHFTDDVPFNAFLQQVSRVSIGDDNTIFAARLPEYCLSLMRSLVENPPDEKLTQQVIKDLKLLDDVERVELLSRLKRERLEIGIMESGEDQLAISVNQGLEGLSYRNKYSEEEIARAMDNLESMKRGVWQEKIKEEKKNCPSQCVVV